MSSEHISEVEAQTLERLKRALGHERSTRKDYISLSETRTCKVKLGIRESLKCIQSKQAGLIILAQRGTDETRYVILELAQNLNVKVWMPAVSPYGLGKRLNVKGPCQVVTFTGHETNESLDAFGSIRDFILNSILNSPNSERDMSVDNAKRAKIGTDDAED